MVKDLLYPLLQAHNPILQANTPFYTVFGACFAPKSSKFEAGKMIQK